MSKRSEIDSEEFDHHYLQKILRTLFPRKNDFASEQDLLEVIPELNRFGISTKKQLRLLLKKHRKWVLIGEKSPLDALHRRFYEQELDADELRDSLRRQYWYAYPAIVRMVMGKEYGEEYEAYANQRDGI